jgi:hypothetical protein
MHPLPTLSCPPNYLEGMFDFDIISSYAIKKT